MTPASSVPLSQGARTSPDFADPDPSRPLEDLEGDRDTLGHRAKAEELAEQIRRGFNAKGSRVYGLSGPWGSGKTSVVNHVQGMLTSVRWSGDTIGSSVRQAPVCVHFNPWEFESGASLSEELLARLHEAMKPKRRCRWNAPIGGSLLRLRAKQNRDVATALGGATLAALLGWYADTGIDRGFLGPAALVLGLAFLMVLHWTFPTTQNAFDNALSTTRSIQRSPATAARALVVVDDIDRLPAERVLETLRVIKNIGDIPYVNYLLVYDRAQLAKLEAPGRTKLVDWMDKFVVDEMALPIASPRWLAEQLWPEIRDVFVCNEDDAQRVAGHFASRVACNGLSARGAHALMQGARRSYRSTCEDVEPIDALCLEFIRQRDPEVFGMLAHGTLAGPKYVMSTQQYVDRWAALRPILSDKDVTRESGVRAALTILISESKDEAFDRTYGVTTGDGRSPSYRLRFGDPIYFRHSTDDLKLTASEKRRLESSFDAASIAETLGSFRADRLPGAIAHLLESGGARNDSGVWTLLVVEGAIRTAGGAGENKQAFANLMVQAPGRIELPAATWMQIIDGLDDPYLTAMVVAWIERSLPNRSGSGRPARDVLEEHMADHQVHFKNRLKDTARQVFACDLTPLMYIEHRLFWCLPDELQEEVLGMARPTDGWIELLMWSTNGEQGSPRADRAERTVRRLRATHSDVITTWHQVRRRLVSARTNEVYGIIGDRWFADSGNSARE